MNNSNLSRRERKKTESRARILKSARALFQNRGYDDTTIEDIADMADVSKSTFFNYFPTKESLLEGIAVDEVEEIQFLIEADLEGVASPVEKIRIALRHFATDSTEYLRVTRWVLWGSVFKTEGYPPSVMEMEKILVPLIEEAQDQGEIRRDFVARDIATAFLGMYFAAFFHWIREGEDSLAPPEFQFDLLFDMFFSGVAG